MTRNNSPTFTANHQLPDPALALAAEVKQRLAAIVDFSDDAIVSKSLDGIIMTWNRGAERIFGYTAEEAIGKHITLIIPEEHRAEEDEVLARIRRGQIVDHFETIRQAKDGHRLHISLTVSPIKTTDGRIIGASKIARDISERKRSEEKLRESRRLLQESDRRKDEFLATLAHELRNPLAPIRQAANLLKQPRISEQDANWARDVIDRQVQAMSRLLDDLLDISRISLDRIELRKEVVALDSVIESAVEMAQPLINTKQHRLNIDLPAEPIKLEADPLRLAQVVANLLTNAAKYTDVQGSIDVRARRDGQDLVLTISDNGIGIGADTLPRIFEMFSQATPVLERTEGGLGIGLALVRGFVGLHGGHVSAHSEGLGRGSEFTLRLPLGNTSTLPESPTTTHASSDRRYKILIADDNRDTAETLSALMRIEGHDISTAFDGLSALRMAQDLHPDVALVDIGMPRLNGYEFAQKMRGLTWKKKPILIAVTGWGQERDKQRAIDAGFDYHLRKPVDIDMLWSLLADHPK